LGIWFKKGYRMMIKKFGDRLPEETEEDKAAREKRLSLRDIGTTAYKFGPQPPDMISPINPVPEIDTGLARPKETPWGATIRPATEKTEYGEKRFSNVPEDSGRADTTFITEAPKKAEPQRDLSTIDVDKFFNETIIPKVESQRGIKIFGSSLEIARTRWPGRPDNSPEIQAELVKINKAKDDAFNQATRIRTMLEKEKADFDEKNKYKAEQEAKAAKENQARVDSLHKYVVDLKTKQKGAVVALANLKAKASGGDFTDTDKENYKKIMQEAGMEGIDIGKAEPFLTSYVSDLDREISRVESDLKTYDPTYDAMAGVMGQAHETTTGATEVGNIDLTNRPRVQNADGTISTVRSKSFNIDGKEVLLPTISDDGKVLSDKEAVDLYKKTGKHLGKFNSVEAANKYAQQLHEQQAKAIEPATAPKYLQTATNPKTGEKMGFDGTKWVPIPQT
jgi:hypothetical protein